MMLLWLCLLNLNQTRLEKPGMRKALEILRAPIPEFTPTRDVVLHGVLSQNVEKNAQKMNTLRNRLGHAWEWVLTDYGYKKLNQGAAAAAALPTPDLVNQRAKIILELKNGYKVNSIVEKQDILALKA